jgi:glycosyltransferase involved in cell wall biosynthesis
VTSVSVIIPTYNDGDTLQRAINSVFDQTYSDFEIIVIDDGSTDDTAEKVEDYESDRLEYVVHKENKGGSAARNTGIKRASGEYMAFLDADDEWMPDKLEVQISELESKSEKWVGIYCDKENITSMKSNFENILSSMIFEVGEQIKEGGTELLPRVFKMEIELGSSTLVIKRETIERMEGFDPDFRRHQDLEFVVRLLKHGKLAYVDRKLVKKYGGNRPEPEVMEGVKELFLSKFSEDISRLEQEGHKIVDRHKLQLVRDYYEEGRFKQGNKHLRRSHFTKPGYLIRLLWSFNTGVWVKLFG